MERDSKQNLISNKATANSHDGHSRPARIISGISPPPGSPERIAEALADIARCLERCAGKLDALHADVLKLNTGE